MILGSPAQLTTIPIKLGVVTKYYIPIDDDTKEYTATIYAVNSQKYLDADYKYSDTPVTISLTNSAAIPPTNTTYAVLPLSTYYLTRPEVLNIQVVCTTDPADSVAFMVTAGELPALAADTILVYGYLYDVYGEPIKHEPVTFTVLNSASYFDNAPITRLNATGLTDDTGRFELSINRRYDYVFSVSRLNYTKLLKLSTIPDDVLTVEVLVGKGLVCD